MRYAVARGLCPTHVQAAWRRDNPFKALRQQIAKYGVTVEWYLKRLKKQENVCAICGQPETATRNGKVKRLAVDHNHATGEARSLLCMVCNQALGVIENAELVAKLETYLAMPQDDLSAVKLTDEDYRAAGL
jgi:Recombination endonuclease VII